MMEVKYCRFCGQLLSDGCDCERIAAEEHETFIEEYEKRPEVHEGWAFEDKLAMYRRER